MLLCKTGAGLAQPKLCSILFINCPVCHLCGYETSPSAATSQLPLHPAAGKRQREGALRPAPNFSGLAFCSFFKNQSPFSITESPPSLPRPLTSCSLRVEQHRPGREEGAERAVSVLRGPIFAAPSSCATRKEGREAAVFLPVGAKGPKTEWPTLFLHLGHGNLDAALLCDLSSLLKQKTSCFISYPSTPSLLALSWHCLCCLSANDAARAKNGLVDFPVTILSSF